MRVPKFPLEDIEDYYTYYVLILNLSEDIFWNASIPFLKGVAENYASYKNWKNYVEERMMNNGKR